MGKITQKQIADLLGVSVVTVSNALSGKKGVSRELRSAILEMAEELGLKTGQYTAKSPVNYTIGVYVSEWYISVGSSFYWELYQKTAYAASRRHCFTMLEIGEKNSEGEIPRLMHTGKIDGLIIIGKIERPVLENIMTVSSIPVVFLDFYDPSFPCDAVMSENYLGMYRATESLVLAGHREIGFLGNFEAFRNGMERFMGYQKCLMERGLPYDPSYVLTEKLLPSGEMQVTLPARLPGAFACSSDFLAYYLIRALEERGLHVPDDISIAAYDHYLQKKLPFGELTTYGVDMERMAKEAVKRLVKRMKGCQEDPFTRYIEGSMYYGNSIKPAAAGKTDRKEESDHDRKNSEAG